MFQNELILSNDFFVETAEASSGSLSDALGIDLFTFSDSFHLQLIAKRIACRVWQPNRVEQINLVLS